jgi:tRNA(fMet)-specific endonuclease VapC
MAKVLLDTTIIIDFLRRTEKEKTALVDLTQSSNQLYISIITHSELYAGKSVWQKKEAMEELETIFSGPTIIELSREISKKAGEIKAGCNLDLFDAIIAATAIVSNCSLATLNVKDFAKVDGLKMLKI